MFATMTLVADYLLAQSAVSNSANDTWAIFTLIVGIVMVLGMIIGLKMNAFLALIISAIVISLMTGGDPGARVDAVVAAFGSSAAGFGIMVAMASIVGKCMLDNGSADRIVRWAVGITGERKASVGLAGSGFLLGIPVFFDTVFYLLVPLARSLHRQTRKNYLLYLLAIAAGGAATHTLVPPTPGPLLVAANLGVDVGLMIIIGLAVGFPSAVAGLLFSAFVDRRSPVEMRPLGPHDDQQQAIPEGELPPLSVAVLPVILPVILIGLGTVAMTRADREDRGSVTPSDLVDPAALVGLLRAADPVSPAGRLVSSQALTDQQRAILTAPWPADVAAAEATRESLTAAINRALSDKGLFDERAFRGVELSSVSRELLASNQLRMKPVDRRRMNRSLLETALPGMIKPHEWDTPARQLATRLTMWSNPNFALMLSALVAMWTTWKFRRMSLGDLSAEVEESLMSGGVIILITAAGGAFGAMLTAAGIGPAIERMFSGISGGGGLGLLLLAFTIAAVLKVAQGSSTVAMIVASSMLGAMLSGTVIRFNPVYIATAIGSGSLIGSWMNDSGFWVFAKMGCLTEGETLRSWTPLLIILGTTGLLVTILLSQILPLV
jgi:H+/gluconate symporter-like permease